MLKGTIFEISWTVRAAGLFHVNNIDTIDKLLSMSEEDLYKLRGMGKKTINDIKESLVEKGLKLSPGLLRISGKKVRNTHDRNILIWFMCSYKKRTKASLARVFKLSSQRIADIVKKYDRIYRNHGLNVPFIREKVERRYDI